MIRFPEISPCKCGKRLEIREIYWTLPRNNYHTLEIGCSCLAVEPLRIDYVDTYFDERGRASLTLIEAWNKRISLL